MSENIKALRLRLERQKIRKMRELVKKIDILTKDIQKHKKNVEDGEIAILNSLGIVQTQGQEIDRLCVVIHEIDDFIEELKAYESE